MYEIWLALNILFELALMYFPVVMVIALAWIALMALALIRGTPNWRRALLPAALIGVVTLIAGMLAIPALTMSSLAELRYWVDWANLFAVAAGFAAITAMLALPLIATATRTRA